MPVNNNYADTDWNETAAEKAVRLKEEEKERKRLAKLKEDELKRIAKREAATAKARAKLLKNGPKNYGSRDPRSKAKNR